MRTAALDVGGTACRVVVAEATSAGGMRVLLDRPVILGLTRTLRRDGAFGVGLRQLVVETVRRLSEAAFAAGADRTLVGIAPELHAAADLEELRDELAGHLGARPSLRHETEERDLLAAGVAEALGTADLPPLLDLGPRQLRLLGADVGRVAVVPCGVRDLVPSHVDPLHPAAVATLRDRARGAVGALPRPGGDEVVLIGEAARLVGGALLARRYGERPPAVRGLRASAAALGALEDDLLATPTTQRLLLPAVDPAVVDDLAATLTVLRAASVHLEVARVTFVDVSPAEASVQACLVDAPPDTARARAVAAVATPRSRSVAALVDRLGAVLATELDLDADDVRRTVDAALLGDRGTVAPGVVRHRSAARELVTSGLPGVGPEEIVELACLVGARAGRLTGPRQPLFGRLPAGRRRAVARAAGVLRLAAAMAGDGDRTPPLDLRLRPAVDGLRLEVLGGPDADLAVHGARRHLGAIAALWERPVAVTAVPAAVPQVRADLRIVALDP